VRDEVAKISHPLCPLAEVQMVKYLLKMGANQSAVDKRMVMARDYVQAKRLTWVLSSEETANLDEISALLTAVGRGWGMKLTPRPT